MKIGNAIRILRQARELKQGEVARSAGISLSYLSLIESGEREPAADVLRRLSDSLEVPVDVLLLVGGESIENADSEAKGLAASVQRLAGAEARLRRLMDERTREDLGH